MKKKFEIPESLKKRMQNKYFWVSLISVLIVLIKQICMLFGIKLDLDSVSQQLENIVTTIFMLLGVLGIFVNPSTPGLKDNPTDNTTDATYVEQEDDLK